MNDDFFSNCTLMQSIYWVLTDGLLLYYVLGEREGGEIELGDMIVFSKDSISLCQQTKLCLLLHLCSQIQIECLNLPVREG